MSIVEGGESTPDRPNDRAPIGEPPAAVEAAFNDLYDRSYTSLVRLAYVILESNEQAEDLVQDAFAKLYPRWNKVASPMQYVRTTVINACRDTLRHRAVERRFLNRHRPLVDHMSPEPDYLGDALHELPARERIALVLKYYGRLTETEIARTMDCPVGTVKSLLHRGNARLRNQIDR